MSHDPRSAQSEKRAVTRVAWLLGTDLRPYRVPFLERLSRVPNLEVACFYGSAKQGLGAPLEEPVVDDPLVLTRPVVNRHWPFGGHRVAWQSGVSRLLIEDFDVLVCPDIIHNLSVWFLAATHALRKRRLVFFGYGYRPTWSGLTGALRHRARRILLRSADAAIAYTERGRKGYIEAGVPDEKVFITNNTLDTERLGGLSRGITEAELVSLRTALELGTGPILIFVGRLLPEKRIDVLIEAFRQVQKLSSGASLLVIGDGPDRTLVNSLVSGIPGVHVLGPIYDERELAKYFMMSDLLVIPGRIGLTCVHGFAYGVPSITATDHIVAQSPEYAYINHDENGYVCQSLEASVFSDAIIELIGNGPRLGAMKAAALATAQELTMDKMVKGFVDAARKAIA